MSHKNVKKTKVRHLWVKVWKWFCCNLQRHLNQNHWSLHRHNAMQLSVDPRFVTSQSNDVYTPARSYVSCCLAYSVFIFSLLCLFSPSPRSLLPTGAANHCNVHCHSVDTRQPNIAKTKLHLLRFVVDLLYNIDQSVKMYRMPEKITKCSEAPVASWHDRKAIS